MQQQPTMQPGGQPSAAPPPQSLSPKQVQQLQILSRQAASIVLDPQTSEMILAKAEQGDPAQAVAQVVVDMLPQLWEAASQSGQQIDMLTMMVAGLQVIGIISEMLMAAGILTEQEAPQFLAQAGKLAVEMHNAKLQGGGQPAQPGAMQ